MADWVTNEELLLRSDELADVMLTMLANAGIQVDIPGYDDHVDVDAVRESFWLDAADYTSMDPAKLEEEYDEILRTATHLLMDPELNAQTTLAAAQIADWHGTAADAFGKQMEHIQTFAAQPKPVEGADERAILGGYVTAAADLRKSYANNLTLLQRWVDGHRRAYVDLAMPLLTPLPTGTDVDSPDFRYEEFYYDLHDNPGIYAPEVERERTKYVDEKSNGLIGQRLDGEG